MLYDLTLAWRNLRARPVLTLITVLVIGMSIALSITVIHLNDGLQQGIIQASDAFGVLVVGSKGSSQQLVTSTILLQGNPIGNIPYSILDQLRDDPRVAEAIPLAMGDNVGGARIIGTDETFLTLSASQNATPAFRVVDGRYFEANFEAVLGYTAARKLGLEIGDSFVAQHGVAVGLQSDLHDTPHTVVGTLALSNSPYDNAIFTTVESVISIHASHGDMFNSLASAGHNMVGHEITAVLVKPTGYVEMGQIWQEFYSGNEAQAAFPGRALGQLFELFNQGQTLLISVGYLTALMACLTLFLAVYSASAIREPFVALLRSVGASRQNIFRMVLGETILLALIGAAIGRLLGFIAPLIMARQITAQSAIPVPIRFLPQLELYLWLIPLLLGVLAGLIPAIQAYRTNAIEKLFQG